MSRLTDELDVLASYPFKQPETTQHKDAALAALKQEMRGHIDVGESLMKEVKRLDKELAAAERERDSAFSLRDASIRAQETLEKLLSNAIIVENPCEAPGHKEAKYPPFCPICLADERDAAEKREQKLLAIIDEYSRKLIRVEGADVVAEKVNYFDQRERELLTSLAEIREVYAGMDGFVPETCPEGYQQTLLKRMYDIAAEAEAKRWKDEFEEGHRAWNESDEHRNAAALRDALSAAEKRERELRELLREIDEYYVLEAEHYERIGRLLGGEK